MRFLILTQYYEPEIGAPQVRLSALVRELRRAGHTVEVVTALPNHPTGRIFPGWGRRLYVRTEESGVMVHRVWLYPALGSGLRRLLNYFSFMVSCVFGLVRANRPDYLFIESPPLFPAIPGLLAARLWRTKAIFNVADLWPDSVVQLGLMKDGVMLRAAAWLERVIYQKADYVVAVTRGIERTLTGPKAVPGHRVLYLPNGVDTELFQPSSPDRALQQELGLVGKKVILYAGTHGYAHGMEVALKAAELIRHRADICFLFVGDGSEKNRLVGMAQQLSLPNVLFLEAAPPVMVSRLYSFAHVGLSTLRDSLLFEGTRPAKVFASMAAGVPVLYSGAGEGARLVEQAGAGLISGPEDASALAQGVVRLCDDPDLAAQLGSNGRRYVEERLSWTALIEDWLKSLQFGR